MGDYENLWIGSHYLASHFGLVRTDIEFTAPEYILKGAIINGITYGTVPIDDDVLIQQPEQFTLHQNYPNPFNPTTNITYALNHNGMVELVVFNSLGQKVTTLINKFQTAGIHSVEFNGTRLSSGIYFYHIKTEQGILSKKMLLLR